MKLSVVIITFNEEANLARTLASIEDLVREEGEIIVLDSGSTDRTLEIARQFGAKVCVEQWKGFAAQKNSAIAKAAGDWILSLDADEAIDPKLITGMRHALTSSLPVNGYWMHRKNLFLGRWMRHGGFYERKLRLFRRDAGQFKDVPVHEVVEVGGKTADIHGGDILHYQYPTLDAYIEHMNRYSSLGAEIAMRKGHRSFSILNIIIRPLATFLQKYFLRLGFLDGKEGLLLCLYHSVYVSWKYAKSWELARLQTNTHD